MNMIFARLRQEIKWYHAKKKYSTYWVTFYFVGIFLGFVPVVVYGNVISERSKGVPFLKNFTPEQTAFSGKVWDMSATPNGLMYFATDSGLAEYDGINWNLFNGSRGITRSVLALNDSVLVTGSDLDFGIWKKDEYQQWNYQSLYPQQKDSISTYEEFWYVNERNGIVTFMSSQNMYVYENDTVKSISAKSTFSSSFIFDNSIYVGENNELYRLDSDSLTKMFSNPQKQVVEWLGLYAFNSRIFAVSRNNGLFKVENKTVVPVNSALSEELKLAKVFSFTEIDEKTVAFGTVLNGLLITDREGNIIHRIAKNKGLLNNTILSLFYQQSGKLWVGLDYGVAYIDLVSDYTYVFDYAGQFGSASTAILHANQFFLGTNQGLYVTDWNSLDNHLSPATFTLIPESEGQVWTIQRFNSLILVGHDRGLFRLDEKRLRLIKLSDIKGVWSLESLGDALLAGTYTGIEIFDKTLTGLRKRKQMELITGSCNQLVVESDSILWVNIPNFGIIKALLNKELYPVNRTIFKSEVFGGKPVFLKVENNRVVAETDQERFIFNETTQTVEWLEHQPRSMPGISAQPGLRKSVPLTNELFFYPLYNGVAFYDADKSKPTVTQVLKLVLRKIVAFSNYSEMRIKNGDHLPADFNSLRIEMAIPFQERMKYQVRIDDEDKWKLSHSNSVTIVNLKEGTQTIHIQAVNNDSVYAEASLSVSIELPWYKTQLAWFMYVLVLFTIGFIIYRFQQRLLSKQKQELLSEQEKKLQELTKRHEQVLLKLEKERLKEEVADVRKQLKAKTIELANKAKENEEKNRLLQTIKEKFDEIKTDSDPLKLKWSEIQHVINSYITMQDTTFEIQMDELHQEFFKKLKTNYPGLSGNDLRLCAYIKLGFNSKEISDLLNILPSSVYISRSRLRKKLNLEGEQDLFNHLNSI